MIYQTFRNVQFRPLLKNSFHSFHVDFSIHIDLRNTSVEKLPFVSVGITRLVLMCRKASNVHFRRKTRYKMVASRQVDFPYYRGIGRHRERGFGALPQAIGRTTIPFLRKVVVPAAKRVRADLLELAAPKYAEVVSGRKSFKRAAKSKGRQTLSKLLGSGSKQSRVV